jgi:hypothetical protein
MRGGPKSTTSERIGVDVVRRYNPVTMGWYVAEVRNVSCCRGGFGCGCMD